MCKEERCRLCMVLRRNGIYAILDGSGQIMPSEDIKLLYYYYNY